MRTSLHVPLVVVCLVLPCASLSAQRTAESRNMVLVGHNDLSRRSGTGAEACYSTTTETVMPAYRVFHLNDDGHIIDSEAIASDSDEEAVSAVINRMLCRHCEVWQGDQLVFEYPSR